MIHQQPQLNPHGGSATDAAKRLTHRGMIEWNGRARLAVR